MILIIKFSVSHNALTNNWPLVIPSAETTRQTNQSPELNTQKSFLSYQFQRQLLIGICCDPGNSGILLLVPASRMTFKSCTPPPPPPPPHSALSSVSDWVCFLTPQQQQKNTFTSFIALSLSLCLSLFKLLILWNGNWGPKGKMVHVCTHVFVILILNVTVRWQMTAFALVL